METWKSGAEPAVAKKQGTTRRIDQQPRQGSLSGRRVSEMMSGAGMPPTGERRAVGGAARPDRASVGSRSRQIVAGSPSSGSADGPSRAVAQAPGFQAIYHRLEMLRCNCSTSISERVYRESLRALGDIRQRVGLGVETHLGQGKRSTPRSSGSSGTRGAYLALQEAARKADNDGDHERAGAIRKTLDQIEGCAVESWQKLAMGLRLEDSQKGRLTRKPPRAASMALDAGTAITRLRELSGHFHATGDFEASRDFSMASTGIALIVRHHFRQNGGNEEVLSDMIQDGANLYGRMYSALGEMARKAAAGGKAERIREICRSLETVNLNVDGKLSELADRYGSLDRFIHMAEKRRGQPPRSARPEAGGQTSQVAARRGPQPAHPLPVPGTFSFEPGILRSHLPRHPLAVSAARPVGAPASVGTAPDSGWTNDEFSVERALITGFLPDGFDASGFIIEAAVLEQDGLAAELAARRLPLQTIDALLERCEAAGDRASNATVIEYLGSLKMRIACALRASYAGRVDREWLEIVRGVLFRREEPGAGGATSATDPPWVPKKEVQAFFRTLDEESHPAPHSAASQETCRSRPSQ